MSWIKTILREVFGLFVDDGSLAILIVLWVAVTGYLLPHFDLAPRWRGVVLFCGLALILVESAVRFARKRKRGA